MTRPLLAALFLASFLTPSPSRAAEPAALDGPSLARMAELALSCVHRPYPNKIAHVLHSAKDAKEPRKLTPVFYGCFDWHSAVHGHWLLARLARTTPEAEWASRARKALARSFTPRAIAGEVAYLKTPGRESFERPYGLAWLLQLGAELREWDTPEARRWSKSLEPLEQEVVERLRRWLPKLTRPVRSGEHSQTAFALGLSLDWARQARHEELIRLIQQRSRDFFLSDANCPISWEPSGEDFLSPCLAEADLMRRVLPQDEFAQWLGRFLPGIGADKGPWLEPAVVSDPTDPKLVHLDGLNLSRAWMLDGILEALPERDPRRPAIAAALEAHRVAGMRSIASDHYEGSHWLGSFAAYLSTRRGIASAPSHQAAAP